MDRMTATRGQQLDVVYKCIVLASILCFLRRVLVHIVFSERNDFSAILKRGERGDVP